MLAVVRLLLVAALVLLLLIVEAVLGHLMVAAAHRVSHTFAICEGLSAVFRLNRPSDASLPSRHDANATRVTACVGGVSEGLRRVLPESVGFRAVDESTYLYRQGLRLPHGPTP